jgi:hypothetical protein
MLQWSGDVDEEEVCPSTPGLHNYVPCGLACSLIRGNGSCNNSSTSSCEFRRDERDSRDIFIAILC